MSLARQSLIHDVRKETMRVFNIIVACTAILIVCVSCAKEPHKKYGFLKGQKPVYVEADESWSLHSYSLGGNYEQVLTSVSNELSQMDFSSWRTTNKWTVGDMHFQRTQLSLFAKHATYTVITLHRDMAFVPGDGGRQRRPTPENVGVDVQITRR